LEIPRDVLDAKVPLERAAHSSPAAIAHRQNPSAIRTTLNGSLIFSSIPSAAAACLARRYGLAAVMMRRLSFAAR